MKHLQFLLLILSFNLAWANPCSLSFKQVKEAALAEQDILLKDVHESFKNLKPFQYEVEISNKSQISIEEVMGITRNFHDDLITTGDTGIYRIGNELQYIPDVNLVKAYKWGMENINPGQIKASDLIELRKNSLEVQYFKQGRDKKITDFAFKSHTDKAYVRDSIHPDVLEDLKKYGHQVEFFNRNSLPDDLPDFVKLTDESLGVYIIKYPSSNQLEAQLSHLSKKINTLTNANAPPEYIAAVAVQDLLSLHPFADGNGRTARLYGQILYKKLTGKTIVFPPAFHKEMSFSVSELALLISKNSNDVKNPFQLYGQQLKMDNFWEHVIQSKEVRVDIIGQEKQLSPLGDLKYSQIKIRDDQQVVHTLNYNELPDKAKLLNFQGDLYFGKGFKSMPEAQGNIKSFFSRGRKRETLENIDLNAHVTSTRTYQSSFVQTTKNPTIAKSFASRDVEVIYIIDPKDVELLDVNEAYRAVGSTNALSAEQEVLLFGNLDPTRVKGAYVFEGTSQTLFINPHYKAR